MCCPRCHQGKGTTPKHNHGSKHNKTAGLLNIARTKQTCGGWAVIFDSARGGAAATTTLLDNHKKMPLSAVRRCSDAQVSKCLTLLRCTSTRRTVAASALTNSIQQKQTRENRQHASPRRPCCKQTEIPPRTISCNTARRTDTKSNTSLSLVLSLFLSPCLTVQSQTQDS